MPDFTIRHADLTSNEIAELLADHLREMNQHSPPESVHALDLEKLKQPGITFWSIWNGDELVGCGALKELDATHAEIKSMRTDPKYRGQGAGKMMLRHILDEARLRGYQRLSLETGSMAAFEPARRLYASHGFIQCEPFADYVLDPNSVFMTIGLYEGSIARKVRTEEYLQSLGVPINPHLPLVEDDSETELRRAADVARRALVLYHLVGVGFGGGADHAVEWLRRASLWEHVSPLEQDFLLDADPSPQAVANATWRVEALWVLLWSLKKIDKLELPVGECNTDLISNLMPGREVSCDEFIDGATLRSVSEILDATDLIYRLHWAVVDARLNSGSLNPALNSSVVYERHYALNWLVNYCDEGWDDITTDT
jgi:putative acetyltransferase